MFFPAIPKRFDTHFLQRGNDVEGNDFRSKHRYHAINVHGAVRFDKTVDQLPDCRFVCHDSACAPTYLMGLLPSEVDLSGEELATADGVHLTVAKTVARRCLRLVDDEGVFLHLNS